MKGAEVLDYIIENELLKVTVTSHGAQIKSVIRKCDGVEHMWCGDPSVWKYHSPVLFPYAGRVKDGRIEIRNKVVENAPAHGVVRTREHELVEQGSDHVTLALDADEETLKIFPYRFRFLSAFRLNGAAVEHTLTVVNTDNERFSFGIGYHPGFAIPFDDKHCIEDYELRFSDLESPICLDTPTGLLNGKFYTLGKNIRAIDITDGMFDVGSHCMVGLRSKTLGLYEKDSERAVVCTIEDFPNCLIWSTEGKPRFVCIEPWHSLPSGETDSYRWEEKAAAATVAPGCNWSTTMKTEFVR